MASNDIGGNDPDPKLVKILATGLDSAFEQGRQQAIEQLDATNVVSFWLQAVGDGSPLKHGRRDRIERSTFHQVAHLTGYDNELSFPEIVQIATQFFANHIGIFINPFDPAMSPEEILQEWIQVLTVRTKRLYPSDYYPDGSVQFPEPVALIDRCEHAITLLNESELTWFWLQVLTEESQVLEFAFSSMGTSVDVWSDRPIEYLRAGPAALNDPQRELQLDLEFLMQHLFVGARTADQTLDQFGEQGAELALNYDYIHDGTDEL